jgi:hypothetical protein
MDPFQQDESYPVASMVELPSIKKKSTSLQELQQKSQQPNVESVSNIKKIEDGNTKSTLISQLGKKGVEENMEPVSIPIPMEKETIKHEEPMNKPYQVETKVEPVAEWVEVSENHFMLKVFPMFMSPDSKWPIFTCWVIGFLLFTFYGRMGWLRKISIGILSMVIYCIFQNWNIYLALWNEGDYMGKDPWIDWAISAEMYRHAQSDAEAKGIVFFMFLCFICILQIFLYFYHTSISSMPVVSLPISGGVTPTMVTTNNVMKPNLSVYGGGEELMSMQV